MHARPAAQLPPIVHSGQEAAGAGSRGRGEQCPTAQQAAGGWARRTRHPGQGGSRQQEKDDRAGRQQQDGGN